MELSIPLNSSINFRRFFQFPLNTYSIHIIAVTLLIFGCGKEEPYPVIRCTDEEPAWSPDGRYIAYFHNPNDIPIVSLLPILFIGCSWNKTDEENRRPGIWILDLETMESEFLTAGWSPDWSPDGNEIVYVQNRNICKINVETKAMKILKTEGFFPDWSPDNRRIAFSIVRMMVLPGLSQRFFSIPMTHSCGV